MTRPVLDTPLDLQMPDRVADDAGGFTQGWTTLGTLWAEVTPRTGGYRRGPGGPLARAQLRIITRAAASGDPARPEPGQRLSGEGGAYVIRAVVVHDSAGLYLACLADREVTP